MDTSDQLDCQMSSVAPPLHKRYIYKLATNAVGVVISVITQAIVPRGLGPSAYGSFHFLTNHFTSIVGFLDMGTSTCFYVNLSKKPKATEMVTFYAYYVFVVTVAVFLFVTSAQLLDLSEWIWPGQYLPYIYLATGYALLNWVVNIENSMADAYGITTYTEKIRIIQKIIALVIILILFFSSQLGLFQFYLYHYFILLLLVGAFIYAVTKYGHLQNICHKIGKDAIVSYLKKYYSYSHPIFFLSMFGMIGVILDRWILQLFAGSIEQGYYSLSFQIGKICILFTSAMTPLLMRDLSIAHSRNDIKQMTRMFRRYVPLLYSVAAYFSCYVAINSSEIVRMFGGKSYEGAVVAVTLMAFYPMHQTYGQLTASMFYATEQTKIYAIIGVIFVVVGLPITYYLIAPASNWGLGLAANGLAIKMVMLNIIGVNVQLFYNARRLKIKLWKYLAHQVVCVVVLVSLACLSRFATIHILGSAANIVLFILVSGALYTVMVATITGASPIIFGMHRDDLRKIKANVIDYMRR